jgi:Tol biopolymer transport system component
VFAQSTYPPERAKVGFYPVPRFLCGANVDGSGQLRLTDAGLVAQYSDEKPVFSRDGRRVAFVRRFGLDVRSRKYRIAQQSPTEEALAVANADGSLPRALTGRDFVFAGRPAWSPDGARIFFGATRRGDQASTSRSSAACGSSPAATIEAMAEPTTLTLEQQLEEIRAQLAWVRDYL